MTRMKSIVLALIVLVVLGALGFLGYQFFTREQTPEEDASSFKDEYNIVLKNYNGDDVDLSDFKKEFLVVYMWASWCPYCSAELENLSTLKQKYGDSIQVIAVNRSEPAAVAQGYTDALNVSGLTLLLDPTDILYKEIDGYAMPETVFINTKGDVLFHQHGPIQLPEVEAKIQELLQLYE